MQLLNSYTNWRRSWFSILSGKFTNGNPFADLLFYDQGAGQGEFYTTYFGNITLLKTHTDWRTTWNLIIAGIFSSSPTMGLLFYDRDAGVGEFYATDGAGGISLLTSYNDWRTSWTHIVPGSFGGPQTDLLFYDSNSGDLELYQVQGAGNLTDGQGNYAPWRSYPGWHQGWTHIVPGSFGGGQFTNFLFYNSNTGEASFFSSDGNGNLSLITDSSWSGSHTLIVPGLLGGLETDLMIYDAASSQIAVLLEWQGNVIPLQAGDLPIGVWTHVVPGIYSDSGYTDLLFYDLDSGIGSFYRSETPVEWQTGLIQGYGGQTSYFPGEILTLHISSRVPSFNVDIFRRGGNEQVLLNVQGTSTLLQVPDNAYSNGCGWPPTINVAIPADWASGLYIARITATDGVNNDTKDIPFVVRAAAGQQNNIVCILPFSTIIAYNRWGGRSLYGHSVDNDSAGAFQWSVPRAFKATVDRPIRYAVAPLADEATFNDVTFRWTPFLAWLDNNGFAVDYCTSVDLHSGSAPLNAYTLMLSICHDEYWSKEMRDNVEAFVVAGGNAAFFSGNTCWWQVRFEDNNHTMVCYKDSSLDPLASADPARCTVNWYDTPVNRPENTMTGVSWRNGAISPAGSSPAQNFVVRNATHWVFAGTGLANGDLFGTEVLLHDAPGSETDACLFIDLGTPFPTGQDGTPLDFTILAVADLPGWTNVSGTPSRATMGIYGRGGFVFTAATTDWSRGLNPQGPPGIVDIITSNVLNQLSAARQPFARKPSADWIETTGRREPSVLFKAHDVIPGVPNEARKRLSRKQRASRKKKPSRKKHEKR
jgi:hypothetical protein